LDLFVWEISEEKSLLVANRLKRATEWSNITRTIFGCNTSCQY